MTLEEALRKDLQRVTAERDQLLAGRFPEVATRIEALQSALHHELTVGAAEIRKLSEQADMAERELYATLGAALEATETAAIPEPIFGGTPFRTSLGGILLLAAFTLRDRVAAAERARIRKELLDVVEGEYSDLFTGTGYEADIVQAVRLTDLRRVINHILPEGE